MKDLIIHIKDGETRRIRDWENIETKGDVLVVKMLGDNYFVAPMQNIKFYEIEERTLY